MRPHSFTTQIFGHALYRFAGWFPRIEICSSCGGKPVGTLDRTSKSRPNLQPGDIRGCLEQALHEIGPLADEKQIAVARLSGSPLSHSFWDAFEPIRFRLE